MSDPMEAAGFGVVPRWMIYHPQVDAKMIIIFLVLSSRASGKGVCWPSLETLAKESRLSRSVVHETLKQMRTRGLVAWETRTTQRGRVNVYRLLIDPLGGAGGVVQNPDDPSSGMEGGSSGSRTMGSPPSGPEVEPGEVEPPRTNPPNPPAEDPPLSSADADGVEEGSEPESEAKARKRAERQAEEERVARAFEQWWQLYPRKVGKQAARKAFAKALKLASLPTIGRGLEAAVAEWRTRETPMDKIPHATTWLNEGRWEDEHPDLPTAGGRPDGEDGSWMRRTPENTP